MALFAITGQDGPDGAARRNQHRTEHVAYIEALNQAGKIVFAGPLQNDERTQSVGVVILLEAADLDEAKKVAHDDPYVKGGVYAVLSVQPVRRVFPR